MKIVEIAVMAILMQKTLGQVTLHIVNEKNCSGQDFTFSCEDAEMRHLTWSFSYFSDIPVVQFIPALTLSRTYTRITTTDSTSGPSPSFITILNITAADNGGRVQCSVGDAAFSKVMLLSIRNRLSCSATVSIVDIGTSQIAITWTQPTCSELMPDHYLVQWVPEGSSTPVLSDPIATSNNSYNITNLAPNMRYAISLLVVDFCGPTTAASLTAITNTLPNMVLQIPTTGITAGVAVGCLVLALLSGVATGVITFLWTRRCYNKNTSPSSDDKDVYYDTVQSDGVQVQPSPAYQWNK